MTAKLLVREVGQRDYTQYNGDFNDEVFDERLSQTLGENYYIRTGEQIAHAEGERLTREGNVEAFQIWTLHSAFTRTYTLEPIT